MVNIEQKKDEIIIMLRNLEDEANQLIFRCANAREGLRAIKTEDDLHKYCDTYDLEKGFKYIRLF